MASKLFAPINEPLDFFDSVNGFVAQITATEIRCEIFDKVYTINFTDDEPLLRMCEQVDATDEAPPVPHEALRTVLDILAVERRLLDHRLWWRRRNGDDHPGYPGVEKDIAAIDEFTTWLDTQKPEGEANG